MHTFALTLVAPVGYDSSASPSRKNASHAIDNARRTSIFTILLAFLLISFSVAATDPDDVIIVGINLPSTATFTQILGSSGMNSAPLSGYFWIHFNDGMYQYWGAVSGSGTSSYDAKSGLYSSPNLSWGRWLWYWFQSASNDDFNDFPSLVASGLNYYGCPYNSCVQVSSPLE